MSTSTPRELKRRDSILKDVEEAENEKTEDKTSNNTRRSLKRVSFADTTSIKMFMSGCDTNTQWNSTYEEPMNNVSSMEITSISWQNIASETVCDLPETKIVLESPTDDAVHTKSKAEIEGCEHTLDFLSSSTGFKPAVTSAGNEKKLDSLMMNICSNLHKSEIQQEFNSDQRENKNDIDMEMTCNVKITPSSNIFPSEKERQDIITLPNATSIETMYQLNGFLRATALPVNKPPRCEEHTCLVPCGIDIICSGDPNKSLPQGSGNFAKSAVTDFGISHALESTTCFNDSRASSNAMEFTCVADEEMVKGDLDFTEDMTFAYHEKIGEFFSHSCPDEIVPDSLSLPATYISKAKPQILTELAEGGNEIKNSENMNLNKSNGDVEKSTLVPCTEYANKETILQNGRSNTSMTLMTTSDVMNLSSLSADCKENVNLPSLQTKSNVFPQFFEYNNIENTLKRTQKLSFSPSCQDNTQKEMDATLSCSTKNQPSLGLGLSDKRISQVVVKPPSPIISSCIVDVYSENQGSTALSSSDNCPSSTVSTKRSVFSYVSFDSFTSLPTESTELAGLLTAPISNRKKCDVSLPQICESVDVLKLGAPTNVVTSPAGDSDCFERSGESNECEVSILQFEKGSCGRITGINMSCDNPTFLSPKTETIWEKNLKNVTKNLACYENFPVLQHEQNEVNCQNISVKVDNLCEALEETRENGEFEVSLDHKKISENSSFKIVLKLDESSVHPGTHSSHDVSKSNKEDYLNAPARHSESSEKRKRYKDAHPDEPSIKLKSFQTSLVLATENGELQKLPEDDDSHYICADTSEGNHAVGYNDEELIISDINFELVKDETPTRDENKSREVRTHCSIIEDDFCSPDAIVRKESVSIAQFLEEYDRTLDQLMPVGDVTNPKTPLSPLPNLKEVKQVAGSIVAGDLVTQKNDRVSKRMEDVLSVTSLCEIVPDKDSPGKEVDDSSVSIMVAEKEGGTDLKSYSLLEREHLLNEDSTRNEMIGALNCKQMFIHSNLKAATDAFPVHDDPETTSEFCKFCQGFISGTQNMPRFDNAVRVGEWIELKLLKRPLKVFLDCTHHENHEMIAKADWGPQHADLKNPCAKLAVKYLGHLISRAIKNLIGQNVCMVEDYLEEVISAYGKVVSLLKEIAYIHSAYITHFNEEGMMVIISSVKAHLSISLDVKFNRATEKDRVYPAIRVEPRVTIGNLRKKTLDDTLASSDGEEYKLLQMIKSVDFLVQNLAK